MNLLVVVVDDVLEAEDALVEADPLVHLPELDVADAVVEHRQADAAVRPVRPLLDVAGQVRAGVVGAADEGVHDVAVGRDRGELDAAVLVLEPLGLAHAARSTLDGHSERLARVRNADRDVADAVAVGAVEARDLVVVRERTRQDEPDVALLEHVGRAVADARLRARDTRPG